MSVTIAATLSFSLSFNDDAKTRISYILYRSTTPDAYSEPSRTSTMELLL